MVLTGRCQISGLAALQGSGGTHASHGIQELHQQSTADFDNISNNVDTSTTSASTTGRQPPRIQQHHCPRLGRATNTRTFLRTEVTSRTNQRERHDTPTPPRENSTISAKTTPTKAKTKGASNLQTDLHDCATPEHPERSALR